MKLKTFIHQLNGMAHAMPVHAMECGMSRKGNRKLEIQQFIYEPSSCDDTNEYESRFLVVVDEEENILNWEQVA